MSKPKGSNSAHELAFEAFGVRALVSVTSAEEADRVRTILPPGWQPCLPEDAEKRFKLLKEDGYYELFRDDSSYTRGLNLDHAITLLEAQIRAYVALHAPDRIFVHAGVVSHEGRALVLPGMSFAGKTTLVAALVRAGAVYYSDEFAVLDDGGLVHPYGKPLSMRKANQIRQVDHHVNSFGGTQGDVAIPVGVIVVAQYRPGAQWQPVRGTSGEGVMALLANTVAARDRPPEVMRALTRAADGAVVIQGIRGEADALAPELLAELSGSS